MNQDQVQNVWKRQQDRDAARKRASAEAKRVAALKADDGGKDGTRVTDVRVKISGRRTERQSVRARPGTFEWRYGRNKQDALFHAGSHFARLWEAAGATVASSADFLRGTKSGYRIGMAEGRIQAMDKLQEVMIELGRFSSNRLIDYCVIGLGIKEIARKYGMGEREAAAVIHQDLRQCAIEMRYISA